MLQAARERVDILQFSPDGRSLAAPCEGGVQVWHDPSAGRPPAVLDHPDVWSVRFTPDGRKLLLGGRSAPVVIHDLPTGEAVEVPLDLASPPGGVYCDLTPDGLSLVAAQVDPNREPGRLFRRPLADLASSAWSVETTRPPYAPPLFLAGGERFVLFEGRPDSIPFWYVTRDTRTGLVKAKVKGSGYHYHSPVQSADRSLVAARWGACAAVFRADDFGAGPVAVLRNDSRRSFTGLAFHPSGRLLAVTSNDATVKLYDTSAWEVAGAFDWGVGRLRSVAFSPDGMLAAAGGDKGKIVLWDVDL